MKVKRTINKELEVSVEEITLLSVEEVERLPKRLRCYKNGWWLRSPGDISYRVAGVAYDGSLDHCGYIVNLNHFAVRPALIYKSKNLKIGDIICFGDKEWEVIDDKYAFCTTDIGEYGFDKKSNDYEKSEIKEYITMWKAWKMPIFLR